MARNPDKIVVTGLGMVSPLGRDVITSCAAARSGITRLSQLESLQLMDPNTGELEYATGHAVLGCTDGFSGLGRLVRLGLAGLKDLIASSGVRKWNNTGLFINLSSGFYLKELKKTECAKSEEKESDGGQSDVPYDLELRDQAYKTWLIPTILKLANISIDPVNQAVFFNDQSGFIQIMQIAIESLLAGKIEHCIIGGIDSYVEPDSLKAIHHFEILKTPSRVTGFIPGEIASFLLIERESIAMRRNSNIEGVLESLSHRSESFSRLSDRPIAGIALSDTISETIEGLDSNGQHPGLIIGNLNGDPYRAYDWGHSQIRLKSKYDWTDIPIWHPSLSFGEIGAGTAPAAICLAARGFRRRYTRTNNVLVWLSSDNGERGSFHFSKYSK